MELYLRAVKKLFDVEHFFKKYDISSYRQRLIQVDLIEIHKIYRNFIIIT